MPTSVSRQLRKSGLVAWLQRQPPPDVSTSEIRAVAWMILTACSLALVLAIARPTLLNGFGIPPLSADFPGFYLAGRILEEQGPGELYDLKLQEHYFTQLKPAARHLGLPYLYPPFVAAVFRPISRLPYNYASLVWGGISILLFVFGMRLLLTRFAVASQGAKAIPWLLSLSFCPFILETLIGGQISAVAFFVVSLALSLDLSHKGFLSGLTLSLCLYKPPLLLFVALLVLCAGQRRQVAGLVFGVLLIFASTCATMGFQTWLQYLDVAGRVGSLYAYSPSVLKIYKYVDLRTAVVGLTGVWWLGMLVLGAAGLICAPGLVALWRRSRASVEFRMLAWAAAIAWTLVLNAYVPIYDATLAIISLVLLASLTLRPQFAVWRPAFYWLMLFVYVGSWVGEILARVLRVQAFTLILLGLALFCSEIMFDSTPTRDDANA